MFYSSCGRSGTATISAWNALAVNFAVVAHTLPPRASTCCERSRRSITRAHQRLPCDSLGYPKTESNSK